MTSAHWKLLFLAIFLISPEAKKSQQTQMVAPREPGVVKLEDLFRIADSVVMVRIVSGDTENYSTPVHKAEVLRSFKGGAATKAAIYFGPYIGMRLGGEYILFLRGTVKPLAPNPDSTSNYGTVRYLDVLNEGYGAMETSFECIFDGKDVSDECDDAVKVCTDYIKLPSTVRTFPPSEEETPFGCRWIRKGSFLSLREGLSLV
jgi:hypothetical protein